MLRVLQDQTFEKLGDSKSITVDVRVLSATNQNLYSKVEKGTFREDLLYRINLIQIEVPPLRQRRDDIPVLAEYFIKLAQEMYSWPGKSISEDGIAWLCDQIWPGNIRELKNTIERTILLTSSDIIKTDDFIQALKTGRVPEVNKETQAGSSKTLDEMEREMIIKVLEENGGNLSRTSEKLGITRATLYRKMEKHGIQTGKNE